MSQQLKLKSWIERFQAFSVYYLLGLFNFVSQIIQKCCLTEH